MVQTAADILVEVLQDWGVAAVFGSPEDGINGINEAKLDGETVRAIKGMPYHKTIGTRLID